MMKVFELRMKKVMTLSNCPVCGSAVLRAMAPDGDRATAYFDCGSVFSTHSGEEIKAEIGCPQPTAVAAKALNDEVSQALLADGRPPSPKPDLVDFEIKVLEMLAGQREFLHGAAINACLERLASLRLCTKVPYSILPAGVAALRDAKAAA